MIDAVLAAAMEEEASSSLMVVLEGRGAGQVKAAHVLAVRNT